MKLMFLALMVVLVSTNVILVQQEKDPDTAKGFRIGSRWGEVSPLVIVDGIIMDSTQLVNDRSLAVKKDPLAVIDPSDIDSIMILKKDTAVLLYGGRAKDGVILITTKKAKAGKTQKE